MSKKYTTQGRKCGGRVKGYAAGGAVDDDDTSDSGGSGGLSFDSAVTGNKKKDMQKEYGASLDIPLSDNVSVNASANFSPNFYGDRKNDSGVKAGLKFKF